MKKILWTYHNMLHIRELFCFLDSFFWSPDDRRFDHTRSHETKLWSKSGLEPTVIYHLWLERIVHSPLDLCLQCSQSRGSFNGIKDKNKPNVADPEWGIRKAAIHSSTSANIDMLSVLFCLFFPSFFFPLLLWGIICLWFVLGMSVRDLRPTPPSKNAEAWLPASAEIGQIPGTILE